MHGLRFSKAIVALLLAWSLASCGGADDEGGTSGYVPTSVALFNVPEGERTWAGADVSSGSRIGIREITGTASAEATTNTGLPLAPENRIPSVDFPNGIRMDGFSTSSYQSSGGQWVCCNFGGLYYVRFYSSARQTTYLLAPISSNEKPGPEFSMLHRSSGSQSGQTSLSSSYNYSWDTYGVAGFVTEVPPGASAEYQGIWVGRHYSNEYWGDASMQISFETGDVIGLLDNPTPTSGTTAATFSEIGITGELVDGKFVGEAKVDIPSGSGVTTLSGPVVGYIYGPAAEEAGGVFDMSRYSTSPEFTGAFLVKQ